MLVHWCVCPQSGNIHTSNGSPPVFTTWAVLFSSCFKNQFSYHKRVNQRVSEWHIVDQLRHQIKTTFKPKCCSLRCHILGHWGEHISACKRTEFRLLHVRDFNRVTVGCSCIKNTQIWYYCELKPYYSPFAQNVWKSQFAGRKIICARNPFRGRNWWHFVRLIHLIQPLNARNKGRI